MNETRVPSKLPDEITACKITGYRANENLNCDACGGDVCLIRFKFTGYEFGIPIYRAWYLSAPGMREQRVSRDAYCKAERAAGFIPIPGLGPEATASFGAANGMSGRTVETWPNRVFPDTQQTEEETPMTDFTPPETCVKRGCLNKVRPSSHLPAKMYCGEHFTDERRYE